MGLRQEGNSELGTSSQKCFLFGAIPVNNRDFSREVRPGKSELPRDVLLLTQHSKGFPSSLCPHLGWRWGWAEHSLHCRVHQGIACEDKPREKGALQFVTGTNKQVFVWVFLLMFWDFLKVFLFFIEYSWAVS